MKKILISALLAMAPVVASAQNQLIAGFNFGQFLGVGQTVTNGETFADALSIGANWSVLNAPPPGASAGDNVANNSLTGGYTTGMGTASWTNVSLVSPVDNTGPSVNSSSPSFANIALLGDHSGANMALGTTGAASVGFSINTASFSDAIGSTVGLSFAGRADSPTTITWTVGSTSFIANLTSTMTAFSFDLPAGFYGSASSQITAAFAGAGTIDNVQFIGTAIPEPSTYAALLGVLTLAVAGVRRRFAAKAL